MATERASASPDGAEATDGAPASCAIFVGNLRVGPAATTEAELARHFARFGLVEAADVATHRGNERSRGFGFVRFETAAAAAAALAEPDQELGGQPLALSVAVLSGVGVDTARLPLTCWNCRWAA